MPAMNEEENIQKSVEEALKICNKVAKKFEVLVIGGASIDRTDEIVKRISQRDKRVKLIKRGEDKDYGTALALGFKKAKYEYVFYSDSDGQFDFDELKSFVPFIKEYDIIIGYRVRRKDKFLRKLISQIFNKIIFLIFNVKVRDVDCAFKLIKKSVLRNFKFQTKRSVDVEIVVYGTKLGYKIKELPVKHYPRLKGRSEAESLFGTVKLSIIFKTLLDLVTILKTAKRLKK